MDDTHPAAPDHADTALPPRILSDEKFDEALIGAAFDLAAQRGWGRVSIPDAARAASLPLDRARRRIRGRSALLMRFGTLADAYALQDAPAEGPVRDRIFDLIMRRIDYFQFHRAGMLAVLHALPTEPPTLLLLADATRRSMGWFLDTAGASSTGLKGKLRTHGLVAVWLWTLRAWQTDESEDLSATMAALDKALSRAESAAAWLDRPHLPARAEAAPPEEAGQAEQPASPPPNTSGDQP